MFGFIFPVNQPQQHNREEKDRLQFKGKGNRQHRRRAHGFTRLHVAQAHDDEKHIHRVALPPARAVDEHRRQGQHDEQRRHFRLFASEKACRARHGQRQRIVKDHRKQLDEIQILERRFGNQQQNVLVNQIIIADVFAQRGKTALAERVQPEHQKGLIIRRNIIQHAHPRGHRQRHHAANQRQRPPVRLFQHGIRSHRAARGQSKERGECQRLPPRACVSQIHADIRRQRGKQSRRRRAAYDQRAPAFFHTVPPVKHFVLYYIIIPKAAQPPAASNWHGQKVSIWLFTSCQIVL